MIAAIGVLIYGFVVFDLLVREQRLEDREAWIASGRPWGFFWRPSDSSFFAGTTARSAVFFAWLFGTPAWARGSSRARNRLWQFRACVLLWNLVIGGLILSGRFWAVT